MPELRSPQTRQGMSNRRSPALAPDADQREPETIPTDVEQFLDGLIRSGESSTSHIVDSIGKSNFGPNGLQQSIERGLGKENTRENKRVES